LFRLVRISLYVCFELRWNRVCHCSIRNSRPLKKYFLFLFIIQCTFSFGQKESQALIDSLLEALPEMNDDTQKVNLLNKLSFTYYANNPNEGIKYGQQSLMLAEKLQWKKGIAYANNTIGVNYWARSDYPKALEYYFNSLKINEEAGAKIEIAKNLSNIGLVYTNQSDYAKALEYYLKALKINEELKNEKGIGFVLGNIGLVYSSQASAKADNLATARSAAGGRIDKAAEASVLSRIDEDCRRAEEYYLKALKIFEAAGNRYEIARNLGNIGVVRGIKNDYQKALEYYFRALDMHRELENTSGIGKNLGNIGARYLEIARDTSTDLLEKLFGGSKTAALKQAQLYLDSSITIKKELGELDYLKNSYQNLSEAQALLGDDSHALESYKIYSTLKDSVFNSENAKKIAELQLQYEYDKTETMKRAAQEKQALIRNSVYAGLGITVLFLLLLLNQRNKIAKERRQIALEQERTRISRDLHDDLGSGLTGILMVSGQLHSAEGGESGKHIEQIRKTSRQLVDQMGEIVWAMNAHNDTLENLVGYLNTYTGDLLENTSITRRLELPSSIPVVTMSGMMRRNIFLVVKESLNNIMKHANAATVTIQMTVEGNKMSIILADDGDGFEMGKTRRFGNGLINMQSRMAAAGGEYHIESAPGRGTTTSIRFPLA
jgi:signal transduction histidine kinase